jgi:K+-transporting ATPase ATPase C chain
LYDRVKVAVDQFRKDNPTYRGSIPADALTASGSGLDPDISAAYADAQAPRVAQVRHIAVDQVHRLLAAQMQGRDFGILGEPRVNVLQLNLALDQSFKKQ